ncbi:hypothetical protein ACJJTC_004811 [Scirpophaga incertulas]
MCYIFSCFGWLLDLIQRIITFFLACWLSCAVSLLLLVAAIAGVVYGYNYSIAEFVTFKRSDVTLYFKRGHFYEHPDMRPEIFRRSDNSGFAGDSLYSAQSNPPILESEEPHQSFDNKPAPLSDSWRKVEDSRKYAERLQEYVRSRNQEKIAAKNIFSEVVRARIQTTSQAPLLHHESTATSRPTTKWVPLTAKVVTMLFNSSSQDDMSNFQLEEDISLKSTRFDDYIDDDDLNRDMIPALERYRLWPLRLCPSIS